MKRLPPLSGKDFRVATVTDPRTRLLFHRMATSTRRMTSTTTSHLRLATTIMVLAAGLLGGLSTASAAQSSKGAKEIYGYSCCGGGFGTVSYHRGQVIHVEWIRTKVKLGYAPAKTIVLKLSASGPFPSIGALKKAFAGTHPRLGRTNFAAAPIRISNQKAVLPVSLLHVPSTAGAGFYAFTVEVVRATGTQRFVGAFTIAK